MLLRIHVIFFATCLSVYPTRTRAISNISMTLLYLTLKHRTTIQQYAFTLGESIYITLPRCIDNHNEFLLSNYFFTHILFTVKQRCPLLLPLMQGSMQVQVQFPIITISYEIVSTGFFVLNWWPTDATTFVSHAQKFHPKKKVEDWQ